MFKVLGILLTAYVGYALYAGRAYAKSGVGGRSFRRSEEPFGYWSAVAVYALLAAALITVF